MLCWRSHIHTKKKTFVCRDVCATSINLIASWQPSFSAFYVCCLILFVFSFAVIVIIMITKHCRRSLNFLSFYFIFGFAFSICLLFVVFFFYFFFISCVYFILYSCFFFASYYALLSLESRLNAMNRMNERWTKKKQQNKENKVSFKKERKY